MSDILERLGRISSRMAKPEFLQNKGLSNEVGIHFFCYDPADEPIVCAYFDKLKAGPHPSFRLIDCDLYKIFLSICEEKRILHSISGIEKRKGREFLLEQLHNVASPEAFVEKMCYSPHAFGDILLISGVGKVFPFMYAHNILDNIQHLFADIPVVLLYPGSFNGKQMKLFDRFVEGNYYRAFNLL